MKTEKKEQHSYCRSILDDLCRQQIILESQRLKGIHYRGIIRLKLIKKTIDDLLPKTYLIIYNGDF